MDKVKDMTGATAEAAGSGGLVPAPGAGDEGKFLGGDGTWKTPSVGVEDASEEASGLMSAADKKRLNRMYGANSVTSLALLPITKRTVNATLSEQTTLSVQDGMEIGEELLIRCVPSAVWTQPIPNDGNYTSMSGASIDVTSGVPFEISVWCYDTGKYSIMAKVAE